MAATRNQKQCHLMLKGYDEIGRIKWVSKVRKSLQSYGFGDVWLFQELADNELLAPLAVGQRAYVMVRCTSCFRPSVR